MTDVAIQKNEHKAAEQRKVYVPAADIYEENDVSYIALDMPGVATDGLDLELEEDVLTIRGRSGELQPATPTLYAEYEWGDYERAFRIRAEVDRDGIKANLKNGVLTVSLPKGKQAQARKIAVESE